MAVSLLLVLSFVVLSPDPTLSRGWSLGTRLCPLVLKLHICQISFAVDLIRQEEFVDSFLQLYRDSWRLLRQIETADTSECHLRLHRGELQRPLKTSADQTADHGKLVKPHPFTEVLACETKLQTGALTLWRLRRL